MNKTLSSESNSVTIVLVNYSNLNQNYFKKSLDSAKSQVGIINYKINIYLDNIDYEDNTVNVSIIKIPIEYEGKPVKIREYIVNDVNSTYLSFWDSDDIYTPDRLYSQIRLLKETNSKMCFSNFGFFNDNSIDERNYFDIIGLNKRIINLMDENYLGLGIMTAKTEYLKSVLPFPDIDTLDWWLVLSTSLRGISFCVHNKIHGYYRISDNSQSKKINNVNKNDFKKEIRSKIEILESLDSNLINEDILKRLEFLKNIDIDIDFTSLQDNYAKQQYKNIWGGLVKYEEK